MVVVSHQAHKPTLCMSFIGVSPSVMPWRSSATSEQHNDLQASSSTRGSDHFTILYNWLDLHSAFSYTYIDGLVSISFGIVTESSANAEDAYAIWVNVANKLTGKKYGDVKLKCADKVISTSVATNALLLRGK